MKQNLKMILSVLTALLLTFFPVDVSAFNTAFTYHTALFDTDSVSAEETGSFEFALAQCIAVPGDIVPVDLLISGNPGFTQATFTVTIPDNSPILPVLSWSELVYDIGDAAPSVVWACNQNAQGNVFGFYTTSIRYSDADGVYLRLYFRVAENARMGIYPLELLVSSVRNDTTELSVTPVSGSITVEAPSAVTTSLTLLTTTAPTTTTTTTTTIVTDSKPVPYRYGIDVSRWQGEVDWAKVRKSGKVDFAILRAGYGQEYDQVDPSFHTNMKNAQAQGIPCGAYWYSYATTVEGAKKEAQVFLDTIKGYSFEYPVVFDIEDPTQTSLSKKTISAIIDAFCGAVEAEGYYCVLYSYASFFNSYVDPATQAKYDIWVAHTAVDSPDYNGDYGIWQYSHTGSVSGISGDVDMNYAYRDYPAIIKNGHFNGF